jgi:hypothetical protein
VGSSRDTRRANAGYNRHRRSPGRCPRDLLGNFLVNGLPQVHERNTAFFVNTEPSVVSYRDKRSAIRAGYVALSHIAIGHGHHISVTHQFHEVPRSSLREESRQRSKFPFAFAFLFFRFSPRNLGYLFPFLDLYLSYRTTIVQFTPSHFAAALTSVLFHGAASHAFTAAHPQRARRSAIRYFTVPILS